MLNFPSQNSQREIKINENKMSADNGFTELIKCNSIRGCCYGKGINWISENTHIDKMYSLNAL